MAELPEAVAYDIASSDAKSQEGGQCPRELGLAAGESINSSGCTKHMRAVLDALEVLHGKWKLPILVSLMVGTKRFRELSREIPKISDKMLSKELRELESHALVKRTVFDSFPVVVEYSLTPYGETIKPVMLALRDWGQKHRETMMAELG
jgi:DNA-binding HxlR family transcriptional regulator